MGMFGAACAESSAWTEGFARRGNGSGTVAAVLPFFLESAERRKIT